jgi:hypothetical protein
MGAILKITILADVFLPPDDEMITARANIHAGGEIVGFQELR